MNPVENLLDEHRHIMAQIADLRITAGDLQARGDAALPEALPVLRRIGHMMNTQLALHAKKEEEALFPALEAILGPEAGLTIAMRDEHKDIHAQGESLRQTLSEANDLEHLAIQTGGVHLRELANSGYSADGLRATAEAIIDLLETHFAREEQILFPMAEQMLDAVALAEIGVKMEQLA